MSKRERCTACQRPLTHCYCHLLVNVDNHWPVKILQHPLESRHALGTARIAALCLGHCETETATSHSAQFINTSPEPVLLYPGPDSLPLEALADGPIRPLLFIDATWRKSRRMLLESPALARLPKYNLSEAPTSRYRIRREPNSQALSTLEAIVHSLALLEGNGEKYQPLLQIMDALIDEQIAQMGQDVYERNYKKN